MIYRSGIIHVQYAVNFTAYSYGPVYEKEKCTIAMDYRTDIQGGRVTRVSCRFHF